MEERFTDLAWTTGDFNNSTTSGSQTALQDSYWFIKYYLSKHLNFKKEKPSISLISGTSVHEYFQGILSKKFELNNVEKHFKIHLEQYEFDSERKKAKAKFILDRIKGYVERHIQAIKEISTWKDDWIIEEFFSNWYDNKYMNNTLNLATEGYIDTVNKVLKLFTEHKNKFGTVKLSPLKKESKKENKNRFGNFTYNKSQKIKSPQFTHCIQTALYSKNFDFKFDAHLIYVGDEDYTIFNKSNCWELSNDGLKFFFNKFIQINIKRQEMLRIANGDIRKLAIMIGVDWSEIRNYKNNFILENYYEEDMKKLEDFYEKL